MTVQMKGACVALLVLATAAVHGQQPVAGGREGGGRPAGGRQGGAARQAPQPIPLFFRETWKAGPAAVAASQAIVANPDLALGIYGKTPAQPEVNEEGGVPHLWTGLCAPACAVTLKHKASFVDLRAGRA